MKVDLSFSGTLSCSTLHSLLDENESEITSINLEYCTLSEDILQLCNDSLPKICNLRSVNLQDISPDFTKLDGATVSLFLKNLVQVESLEQLNLQGCNLTETSGKTILLNMTQNLRWINMVDNPLLPEKLMHLIGFRLQTNVANYLKMKEKENIEKIQRQKREEEIADVKLVLDDQVLFFEQLEIEGKAAFEARKIELRKEHESYLNDLECKREEAREKQAAFMTKLMKKKKKKKKK